VIWMTFAVGLAFQFPLVLILLIRVGVLSVEKLRKSRRFVLVLLMVSAALITPGGDPVSLCILTIPLYFLFEVSVLVGTLIERQKLDSAQSEDKSSGIGGSAFLLVSLLVLGGTGAWLYQNWDKAESFLLNLSSDSEASATTPGDLKTTKTLPKLKNETFILELSPIDMVKDGNFTISEGTKVYRAQIRQ